MKLYGTLIQNNIEWIDTFCLKIGFSQEVISCLKECYLTQCRYIEMLCNKNLKRTDCERLVRKTVTEKGNSAYMIILAVTVLKARNTLSQYRKKGINEEIFYDTMSDILIWCQNCKKKHGVYGIEELNWLKNHLNCEIFRLGRLQFQPTRLIFPPYISRESRKKTGLRNHVKALFIHIPQGEKLIKEDCEKSITAAREFFKNYRPDSFICESWLLFDGNKEFMKENSNIILFASLFDLCGSEPNPEQTIERIFGRKEKNPELYPENSSLQKSCKKHILSGGKIGIGFGIIKY